VFALHICNAIAGVIPKSGEVLNGGAKPMFEASRGDALMLPVGAETLPLPTIY
jgi:hypothetical protein